MTFWQWVLLLLVVAAIVPVVVFFSVKFATIARKRGEQAIDRRNRFPLL